MHGSTRDRLEELLAARGTAKVGEAVSNHVSSCPECSSELEAMKIHSQMLQQLRAPEEIEPAPGFYARVLQRIEQRAKHSIWFVFIYSPFGKRLVFASLLIAAALGSYVITEESREGHLQAASMIAQGIHEDALVEGNPAQQRDAVLANFAVHPIAYRETAPSEGSLQ